MRHPGLHSDRAGHSGVPLACASLLRFPRPVQLCFVVPPCCFHTPF